jgi:DNA-binding XRE family transcriptional regulator
MTVEELTAACEDRYNKGTMGTTLLAPNPETIGRKIAERRRELGLSQEELAEGTGLARATINRFEKGHREPSIRNASRIAAFLRIRTAHLLPSA